MESLHWQFPLSWYLFEPFMMIAYYLSSLRNPLSGLYSLLGGTLIFYFLLRIRKLYRKNISFLHWFFSTLWGFFLIGFSFFLFIFYILFFPLPKVKPLVNEKEVLVVDFHSHTLYSHDGLVSPEENLSWHLATGFNGLAITDHGEIEGTLITHKIAKEKYPQIFVIPGEEINDNQGNKLLVLGLSEKISSPGSSTEEIVKLAHQKGGTVIVAHVWDKKGGDWDSLVKAGVDGFEVKGRTKQPLSRETERRLVDFCQKNGLVMIAGTNWHGWGQTNHLWTLVKLANGTKLSHEEKLKMILGLFREKKIASFQAITFSPFNSLNFWRLFSLAVWLIGGIKFFHLPAKKLNLFFSLFFLGSSIFFLLKGYNFLMKAKFFTENKLVNQISPILFLFGLFSFGLGLFLLWEKCLKRKFAF